MNRRVVLKAGLSLVAISLLPGVASACDRPKAGEAGAGADGGAGARVGAGGKV